MVLMGWGWVKVWGSVGKQWRNKQERGSGVLTPACSIVYPHPGAWVHAHSYHLLHRQPGGGSQKEKIHGSCDSRTGHLEEDGWKSPLMSALGTTQLDPSTRFGILVQIGVRGRNLSLCHLGLSSLGFVSRQARTPSANNSGRRHQTASLLCWPQSLLASCWLPTCPPSPTHWS